ncbi:hypothetical protein M758_6G203900 [Ceratodon purpureus]|nr:hypothetical protein M758_6G203900 [Ceratodon purpureus]
MHACILTLLTLLWGFLDTVCVGVSDLFHHLVGVSLLQWNGMHGCSCSAVGFWNFRFLGH